eukprot:TRINITY_DN21013_c0_g1_i1.p1 TRINITY_DN21013_c0_g1~~TRINITY_DN21013_c0_g1_i1.p1  ORF type:complete len:671 (-),score=141.82 TRINITY_DN21013_c0_g1_i1:60-2072(-)
MPMSGSRGQRWVAKGSAGSQEAKTWADKEPETEWWSREREGAPPQRRSREHWNGGSSRADYSESRGSDWYASSSSASSTWGRERRRDFNGERRGGGGWRQAAEGFTGDEAQAKEALLALQGKWCDDGPGGSKYEVTDCVPGSSLSVQTVRSDGRQLFTEGLIRLHGEGARVRIAWGEGTTFVLGAAPAKKGESLSSAEWVALDGRRSFRWKRDKVDESLKLSAYPAISSASSSKSPSADAPEGKPAAQAATGPKSWAAIVRGNPQSQQGRPAAAVLPPPGTRSSSSSEPAAGKAKASAASRPEAEAAAAIPGARTDLQVRLASSASGEALGSASERQLPQQRPREEADGGPSASGSASSTAAKLLTPPRQDASGKGTASPASLQSQLLSPGTPQQLVPLTPPPQVEAPLLAAASEPSSASCACASSSGCGAASACGMTGASGVACGGCPPALANAGCAGCAGCIPGCGAGCSACGAPGACQRACGGPVGPMLHMQVPGALPGMAGMGGGAVATMPPGPSSAMPAMWGQVLPPMGAYGSYPAMMSMPPVAPMAAPVVPVALPNVHDDLRYQIEYYFSEENLSRDFYLRRQMSSDGYVPLIVVGGFKRVRSMVPMSIGGEQIISLLGQALSSSQAVELDSTWTKVRRKNGWQRFILKDKDEPSPPPKGPAAS